MIEKALKYITGLKAPILNEIDGETYSDKQLYRIHHDPKAEPIKLSTLTSLVDYLTSNVDFNKSSNTLFIHVQSPTEVSVFSALDEDRERECLVKVIAQAPSFNFDSFYEHEPFCIALQSKFFQNNDRDLLLKFAGTVEAGSVSEYGDDGVSQKATIKTGIASKGEAIVPNPVVLVPFRTFLEVAQPPSSFVFRMKQDKYDGIKCGLFEADGGAWKYDAMLNIKAYLKERFAEYTNIVVIS